MLIRNEMVVSGERSGGLDHFATLFERTDKLLDAINARLDRMSEEIAEQFAALSATVVHGFSEPKPP